MLAKHYHIFKTAEIVSLSAIFFLFPITPALFPILLVLLFVSSLFNGQAFRFRNVSIFYFVIPVFWLLHVIGLFNTENYSFAFFDIEVKLSFLLVPLVFLKVHREVFEKKHIFFLFFILGVIVSSILCLIQAGECYEYDGLFECYEGSRLAYRFHTTYLASYFIIALFFIWSLFFSYKRFKWIILPVAILTGYFSWFIYHFYALGPWVSLFIVMLTFSMVFLIYKKRFILFPLVFLLVGAGAFIGVKKFELLASGYNAVTQELTLLKESPSRYIKQNKNDTQSIKARILLWHTSAGLIKENPLGVGTGDVKDVLIQRYVDLEMYIYAEKQLNPHNQYLQTGIALGLQGMILLIFSAVCFFIVGFKNKSYVLIGIVMLFYVGMLFESMLETQAGVIPFTVFIYFLSAPYFSKNKL